MGMKFTNGQIKAWCNSYGTVMAERMAILTLTQLANGTISLDYFRDNVLNFLKRSKQNNS